MFPPCRRSRPAPTSPTPSPPLRAAPADATDTESDWKVALPLGAGTFAVAFLVMGDDSVLEGVGALRSDNSAMDEPPRGGSFVSRARTPPERSPWTIQRTMLVRYFMTTAVTTLTEETPCRAALELFRDERIRRAPVLRDGKLVGMISDRDLLRVLPYSAAEASTEAGQRAERTLVGAVMARSPASVTPDTHLEDVASLLLQRKIGGVPVLDRGEVVGILTESDLFRAIVQVAGHPGSARFTLSLTPSKKEPEDVSLLGMRLGLRVVTRLTHASRGGQPLVTLRVVGARWDEFSEVLTRAGYSVIEVVPPKAAAA